MAIIYKPMENIGMGDKSLRQIAKESNNNNKTEHTNIVINKQ